MLDAAVVAPGGDHAVHRLRATLNAGLAEAREDGPELPDALVWGVGYTALARLHAWVRTGHLQEAGRVFAEIGDERHGG